MLATDGTLAHGERTMNTKRLAALVALSALLSTAAPAMAVTSSGTVNVEWNYAITGTLNLYTHTDESGSNGASSLNAAGEKVYWQGNGSTSSGCNGTTDAQPTANDTAAEGTVNFGLVVADSTDYTNCLEVNAVDAYIVTNDSLGANITAVVTSGQPSDYDTATNGSLLCLLPANTWSTTGNTAWAASSRVAAVAMSSTTACSSGTALTTTAATILALTKSTTGSDLNGDMQLNMGPQMQSGSQTVVVTYTLTTN
jgi:hypothetical protein